MLLAVESRCLLTRATLGLCGQPFTAETGATPVTSSRPRKPSALTSSLVGGAGRDGERIVKRPVSTTTYRQPEKHRTALRRGVRASWSHAQR
jgi:hypothetical protein